MRIAGRRRETEKTMDWAPDGELSFVISASIRSLEPASHTGYMSRAEALAFCKGAPFRPRLRNKAILNLIPQSQIISPPCFVGSEFPVRAA